MAKYEVALRLGKALCQSSTGKLAYKLEEMVVYRILTFRNSDFFISLIH